MAQPPREFRPHRHEAAPYLSVRVAHRRVRVARNALYDTISAENGLLARHGELLYKVPVSVLKSETNKLLCKAGQDTML